MATKITTKYLLDLVSRSFALTIPLLDKNKKNKVEIQYLLARVIDTIEDSNHNIEDKETLINGFINILRTGNLDNIDNFKNIVINKTINENDKILIENLDLVLKTFFNFNPELKNISISYLKEMGYGMIYYQDHNIVTFEDLNDYCYYVAGTVGLYLTELVKILDNIELNKEKAKKFGIFLQKINIIKDAYIDYKENRIFWPTNLFANEDPFTYFSDEQYLEKIVEIQNIMVNNALNDMKDTIEYIMDIEKKSALGYKQFCLISVLLGYETLKVLKDNNKILTGEVVKIQKKKTLDIVTKVKSGFYTNKKLEDIKNKIIEDKFNS